MINTEELRKIVLKQKDEINKSDGFIRREILDEILNWFEDSRVIILTGIRRCGKSTILKELMQNKKNYSYVNFEDERFLDFKAQDFEKLNEILIEIYGNIKIYFFDEIQNIEKFETFVRRLQDDGNKVIITGSNASLLSKEFGTRLTGRYKPFEIYPFSFFEFLKFLNVANAITVKEYIFYLSNSYFFFELPKFDFALKKMLNAPKKIYIIDSAFHKITGFNFSPNSGKNLENLAFIELKRRKKEVYYFNGKNECDFLIKEENKITQ